MRAVHGGEVLRDSFRSVLRAVALVAAAAFAPAEASTSAEFDVAPAGAAAPAALRSAYEAASPVTNLRAWFLDGSVELAPKSGTGWRIEVSLVSAGGEGAQANVAATRLVAGGNRVDYSYGPQIEGSYTNGPGGLTQSFRLLAPPADGGPMVLDMAVGGNVGAKLDADLHKVDFLFDSLVVARFADVEATDVDGNEVPVRVSLEGSSVVRIVLERAPTAYPVTVRGTFNTPKARRSASELGHADEAIALTPAAAPSNDTCFGAEVIPGAGPFPLYTAITDLSEATVTGDPVARPACAFPGEPVDRSLWYAFTPASSGTYSFTACRDASVTTVDDTILAIYTSSGGCAGPFTQVLGGCDDDGCVIETFQSYLEHALVGGTTYYVVVWNQGPAPVSGSTDIHILVRETDPTPPANDTCSGATVIPAGGPFPYLTPTTTTIASAGTAGDPPAPTCQSIGVATSRSIWFRFTPSVSGLYTVSSCAGDFGGTATTVEDTILGVYTSPAACAGPFTEIPTSGLSVGCDDDSCSSSQLQSYVRTSLTAGVPYYLVLSQVGTSVPPPEHASAQLRISRSTGPANDSCDAPGQLVLDTPVGGTTDAAGDEYRATDTTACFVGLGQVTSTAGGRDVVYSFLAPTADSYSFKVTGFDPTFSRNLVLQVASDCPTGAPPLTPTCVEAANRNSSVSSEEVDCVPLTAGSTVYAFVDEHAFTVGSAFTIEVNRCATETEPNDTTAQAGVLTCGKEGSMGTAGDVDFYAVGTHPAGSRLFAMVDGIAGNTNDFDLRATTDVDTLEFDDLNLDTPFGLLAPVIAGTPLTGVASFLRVDVHAGSPSPAEPYRLYGVVEPPIASATAESEPNDTTAQADESPTGYYAGSLAAPAPSTDVDLLAFNAISGSLIFVALDGDPLRNGTPINPALALLDSAGNAIISTNDGAGTESTTPGTGALTMTTPFVPGEGLTWRARYTGRYYAKVSIGTSSITSIGAGDYLLSVSLDCTVAADQDADGVPDSSDCAPANPNLYSIPPEATGVRIAGDKRTLSWTAVGGGTASVHDALRGTLPALPVGPGGGDETCLGDGIGTTVQDVTVPAVGTGLWYLVRGSNACGVGTYGTQRTGGVAGAPRVSTTCP